MAVVNRIADRVRFEKSRLFRRFEESARVGGNPWCGDLDRLVAGRGGGGGGAVGAGGGGGRGGGGGVSPMRPAALCELNCPSIYCAGGILVTWS